MDPNQIQQGDISPQIPQPPINQNISEEQKEELLGLIKNIRAKIQSLSAVKFASNNKSELLRRDLLKKVFEQLQSAGVDLTDRQSVSDFIERLRQVNPEFAEMFEQAMNVLLGGETGGEFATPEDSTETIDLGTSPQNNMNNINPNETLSQEVQGPFSQAG